MTGRVHVRQRVAAVVLVAVVAALAAAPALARSVSDLVVPFRSVAGVGLRDSTAQVRRVLGTPSHIFRARGRVYAYDYRADHIQVVFDAYSRADRAIEIGATGGPYHTIRGIHLGIAERIVKQRLRGDHHFNCAQVVSCTMWDGAAFSAAPNTSFSFRDGRLIAIAVQD